MTALSAASCLWPRPGARPWAEAAFVMVALGAVVVARLAATRAGLDPIVVGAGFGLALLSLAVAAGGRFRMRAVQRTHALAGVAFGLILVAIVLAGVFLAGHTLVPGLARPASPFLPWAMITIVVAVAEEAVIRGLLFDRVRRAGGTLLALAVTTAVFALVHVPSYGWHVVPLDVAVGFALGGLRIVTRGFAAPAVAHAVADLATWWL